MKKLRFLPLFLGCWLLSAPGFSQGIILKPFIGYANPRLGEVNDNIQRDINALRQLNNDPLPPAEEFGGGKRILGLRIESHLNDDYFANVTLTFYKDDISSLYAEALQPVSFEYRRSVQTFDVMVGLHYYFNYSEWRRFNKYLAVGAGLIQVNADSKTFYQVGQNLLFDSNGEFSTTNLSALIGVGGEMRLAKLFSLWAEGGYQVSNVGQLDGKVTTIDNPQRRDFTTEASFDLSGFYLRGGVGISLGFLN